jgi:uncharacterized protein
MIRRSTVSIWAAAAAILLASPAQAQFSDSYNFLKAVRDADVNKANEFLAKPGTVTVDTKDVTNGETALHIVTKRRDVPWINYLVQHGAKPDVRDKEGNTPLLIAAQMRFIEGATALLRGRAQVNMANNSGETALIRAVQLRDAAMVRLLMQVGANPDKTDTIAGMSARDYAKRDARGVSILKILEETTVKPAASVSGPKL